MMASVEAPDNGWCRHPIRWIGAGGGNGSGWRGGSPFNDSDISRGPVSSLHGESESG